MTKEEWDEEINGSEEYYDDEDTFVEYYMLLLMEDGDYNSLYSSGIVSEISDNLRFAFKKRSPKLKKLRNCTFVKKGA